MARRAQAERERRIQEGPEEKPKIRTVPRPEAKPSKPISPELLGKHRKEVGKSLIKARKLEQKGKGLGTRIKESIIGRSEKQVKGKEFVVEHEPGQAPKTIRETTTKQMLPGSGLVGLGDVAKAFADRERQVYANIDNKPIRDATEYVANNPFIVASTLTGVGGLIKRVGVGFLTKRAGIIAGGQARAIGRLGSPTLGQITQKSGIIKDVSKLPGIAANSKTARLSTNYILQVLAQMRKPGYVALALMPIIGTYPWGEWALGEAKEATNWAAKNVINTGDPELMREYLRTSAEIFDITMWEQIQRMIPFANMAFSFGEKAKALQLQMKINNALVAVEIESIEGDFSRKFEEAGRTDVEAELARR